MWRLAVVGFALAAMLGGTAPAAGGSISRKEALASSFPGARIEAERVFLTAEQWQRAEALASVELPSALVARYVARRSGAVVGRAYVDTHVVRTKRESLLISLDPEGRVRRIDVTAFLEPPEYQAPEAWLGQYGGRALDEDLALQRAIRPIAGATLTARSVNAAVRRVLAIDAILEEGRAPSVSGPLEGRTPSVFIPSEGRAPSVFMPLEGRAPSVSEPLEGRAPSVSEPLEGRAPSVSEPLEGRRP